MSLSMMCMLVVGKSLPGAKAMLDRLRAFGWGSQSVETLGEAQGALETLHFDVVLCAERLSDGCGYDFVELVARRAATLYIAVALSESCLWMAAVERGERTLGNRALDSRTLELEILHLLSSLHGLELGSLSLTVRLAAKSTIPARRASAAAGARGSAQNNSKPGPAKWNDSETDPLDEIHPLHAEGSHRRTSAR